MNGEKERVRRWGGVVVWIFMQVVRRKRRGRRVRWGRCIVAHSGDLRGDWGCGEGRGLEVGVWCAGGKGVM